MTDKEKLRESLDAAVISPATGYAIVKPDVLAAAQAHLATLDAVSKEDAEKVLHGLDDLTGRMGCLGQKEVVDWLCGNIGVIRALLRAAAGRE